MLAATAYALTTRPPLPAPVTLDPPAADAAASSPATAAPPSPPSASAPATSAAQPAAATPALAALFRKRLADAELLNRFDLSLEARAWTMQAHLDDEETARFERILNSFIKEHHITFPVSAKAVTAEAMLPFRIGQVISGANASVVTQDGARLYVGDDYRGVRLVAIQPNRVTFFGKRKIEVIW
jgi:type III secretion protein D